PDPAMVRAGMPDPVLIGDPHRRELARSDPGFEYFGSHAARVGLTSRLRLREPSVDESGLLIEGGQPPLQAIILAPDPPPTDRDGGSGDLLGRLAFHLGLRHDGLAFSPTPGSRKVMA